MRLRTFRSPLAGVVLAGALLLPAVAEAQALAATTSAGKVTLYRDAMGVPHVFADTSAAVMFGAGYALAQDRLAAMELQRRGAAGRRAENCSVELPPAGAPNCSANRRSKPTRPRGIAVCPMPS